LRGWHLSRANVALPEFNAAVPGTQTISAVEKWMNHGAELAGCEPTLPGPRLAGVPG
jgi:hypothetical protein